MKNKVHIGEKLMTFSFIFSILLLALNILGFIQISVVICLIPFLAFFVLSLCVTVCVFVFIYKTSNRNTVELLKKMLNSKNAEETKE